MGMKWYIYKPAIGGWANTIPIPVSGIPFLSSLSFIINRYIL